MITLMLVSVKLSAYHTMGFLQSYFAELYNFTLIESFLFPLQNSDLKSGKNNFYLVLLNFSGENFSDGIRIHPELLILERKADAFSFAFQSKEYFIFHGF